MRFKTSLYIDENIDKSSDERAEQKKTSKSKIIECDLQRFMLLLSIGEKIVCSTLDEDSIHDVIRACSCLSGEIMKANFLITGNLYSLLDKDLREKVAKLSPIERLYLLDTAEGTN